MAWRSRTRYVVQRIVQTPFLKSRPGTPDYHPTQPQHFRDLLIRHASIQSRQDMSSIDLPRQMRAFGAEGLSHLPLRRAKFNTNASHNDAIIRYVSYVSMY